ncbi:MAG: ABC transporter permease, partial [Anaerolineae bacterium]|nr:ABC transporter permease [Anaerolineae bacterium]
MFEKLSFYIQHSFNDLRVNGQRTLFALLCIAAGVAAIVSLQTLGVMIKDTLTGSLQESNGGDLQVYFTSDFHDTEEVSSSLSDAQEQRGIDDGVIARESTFDLGYITLSGVEQVVTWFENNTSGQVDVTYTQINNTVSSMIAISLPAKDTEKTFIQPYIIEAQKYPLYGKRDTEDGQPLSAVIQGPNDIVLSRNLADDLNASVGDVVRLSGGSEDFTVRGIVSTDTEGGFENFIGALFGYYYVDVSAIELFDGITPGAATLYVKLEDPTELEALSKRFEQSFPYLHTFTTEDLEEQNTQISNAINQLVIIMGLVSLLIGGIGIVNTMLVIVSRRTTEVAVLKTIGLEAEQVTVLFLVEAIIMGIFGSLLGIVLGWIATYGIKGVAEGFLGQTLTFRITATPPITGFVVGVIVTTIFGFLPTLAAGQVRPNLVLRPSDTVIPKAGRSRSFVALLFVIVSLSLVAQVLARDLMDSEILRGAARSIGGLLGVLAGLTMVGGGIFAGWARRNVGLRILRWVLFPVGLFFIGTVFGGMVPALLILFSTFIIAGFLYMILWVLIWSIGGGALADLWFLKTGTLSTIRQSFSRLPALLRWPLTLVLYPVTLVVWIINSALIVVMIPFWLIGRVLQRLAIVDMRIALRSMLAAKGRNASTLLALVVGVFTLSLITMLATAISNRFEELLENEVGGNVIVLAAGQGDTLETVNSKLDSLDGVHSYSSLATFNMDVVSLEDVSAGRTLSYADLERRVQLSDDEQVNTEWLGWALGGVDARGVDSNLPDVDFYAGRQLSVNDVGPWDPDAGSYPPIVVTADEATIAAGLEVGDRLTVEIGNGDNGDSAAGQRITFEIVGMVDRTGNQINFNFGSMNYAPRQAFDGVNFSPDFVSAIVDVDEKQIRTLRREMNEEPGVFVLETKLLNDLINRMIEQFTSFPILVAG